MGRFRSGGGGIVLGESLEKCNCGRGARVAQHRDSGGRLVMRHFDYRKAAAEAAIPKGKLARLRAAVRREFPHDDMMFELHMLRTCTAIRDGWMTTDEALVDTGKRSDPHCRKVAGRTSEGLPER